MVRTLSGRALLLVDGIDEAPEKTRGELRDRLRRLLRVFSGNGCLVTSRPSAVSDGWLSGGGLAEEDFVELSLAPMSRDQVARFIRDWHSAARLDGQSRAAGPRERERERSTLDEYEQRLLHSVRIYRELRQLATNPLMCGLICALNRDRAGSLPSGRKELYDAALEMLLQRRDPERDVLYADDVRLQQSTRERLLQKLAHAMLEEDASELTRERAVGILEAALPAMPAARAQGTARRSSGICCTAPACCANGRASRSTSSTAPSRTTWPPRRSWPAAASPRWWTTPTSPSGRRSSAWPPPMPAPRSAPSSWNGCWRPRPDCAARRSTTAG
ncbi:hypothetical protein STENM327S_08095 [Streptomyces tendae]